MIFAAIAVAHVGSGDMPPPWRAALCKNRRISSRLCSHWIEGDETFRKLVEWLELEKQEVRCG